MCGRLNENGFHKLLRLSACSTISGTFGEGSGGEDLLDKSGLVGDGVNGEGFEASKGPVSHSLCL